MSKVRGFTLLEVVVTMGIMFIILGALFGVVSGQQAAFYQGNMQRAAQGSVRAALSFVEQKLALAGYGMDPSLAFDFTSTVAPCPALANPCLRDRIDGNDELVFFARNPRYWVPDGTGLTAAPTGNVWVIAGLSNTSVTVVPRGTEVFAKGQILQAVCANATSYAYFTVDQTTAPGAANITLTPISASNPFARQDVAMADGCFTGGTARLFLIDRFRFHVRPVSVEGQVIPYLVLDRGLDARSDGWDEGEEIVIAEGIESFQVAYDMNNPALAPRGATAGAAITFAGGALGTPSANGITTLQFPGGTPTTGQTAYAPTSWYGNAIGPPLPAGSPRLTDHQANIRAVRVSLVGRAPAPNATGPGTGLLLPVLNQNTLPSWVDQRASYGRTRVDATITVRNMVARGLLYQ
jgi:type IV pilus assembly protein PilW